MADSPTDMQADSAESVGQGTADTPNDSSASFELETELQVTAAADSLGEVPGIQPQVWETLDDGERLGVLQDVENRMAAIQDRPPVPVVAADLGPGLYGGFNGEAIAVNSEHLAGGMPVGEMLDTIVHEGRHAYQDYAVNNPGVVEDQATVDAWAANMAPGSYLTPEEYGQELYISQPVEADAWAYAGRVIDALGERG